MDFLPFLLPSHWPFYTNMIHVQTHRNTCKRRVWAEEALLPLASLGCLSCLAVCLRLFWDLSYKVSACIIGSPQKYLSSAADIVSFISSHHYCQVESQLLSRGLLLHASVILGQPPSPAIDCFIYRAGEIISASYTVRRTL